MVGPIPPWWACSSGRVGSGLPTEPGRGKPEISRAFDSIPRDWINLSSKSSRERKQLANTNRFQWLWDPCWIEDQWLVRWSQVGELLLATSATKAGSSVRKNRPKRTFTCRYYIFLSSLSLLLVGCWETEVKFWWSSLLGEERWSAYVNVMRMTRLDYSSFRTVQYQYSVD